jgi:6-phosphogluconolactonase
MKFLTRPVLVSGLLWWLAATAGSARDYWVYVGTFTEGLSQGIYVARLNADNGRLSPPALAARTPDPSYLAVGPDQKCLYAVNESPGQKFGTVSAFSLQPASGQLEYLNQKSTGGPGPCHVSLDHSGRVLLVANYAGGSIQSLPILSDGRLGDGGSFIQYQGRGVNPVRQTAPHAHFIAVEPANHFALGCDLGTDRVMIYQLNAAEATLRTNHPPFGTVPPGSGPRHLVFSRDGSFVYVVNEMACTVSVFDWNGAAGKLTLRTTLSALPEGVTAQPEFTAAEIVQSPSGRFLYVSVRGHDSISVFAVEEKTGGLRLIQNVSSGGKAPRGLAMDPTGRWLLAGNQKSDNVVELAIDAATGKLKALPARLVIGAPVDFKFVAAAP